MSKAAGGTHPTSSPSLRSNLGIPNLDFWTSVLVQSVVKPSKNLNFKQQKHLKSRATVHRHGQISASLYSLFVFFQPWSLQLSAQPPEPFAVFRERFRWLILSDAPLLFPNLGFSKIEYHQKHHHFLHHSTGHLSYPGYPPFSDKAIHHWKRHPAGWLVVTMAPRQRAPWRKEQRLVSQGCLLEEICYLCWLKPVQRVFWEDMLGSCRYHYATIYPEYMVHWGTLCLFSLNRKGRNIKIIHATNIRVHIGV